MTKQDLLDALDAKFHKVAVVTEQSEEAGVKWYLAGVFDINDAGTGMVRKNIPFYVEDEGLSTEEAYWGPAEPKPTPGDPSFDQRVRAFIASKVADATILYGTVLSMDVLSLKAHGEVIMPDKSKKEVLLTETSPNVFILDVL